MIQSKMIAPSRTTSKQYPYLGRMDYIAKSGSVVVLFTEPKTGMVVYSSDPQTQSVGDHSTTWNESKFYPFDGEITLGGSTLVHNDEPTNPVAYALVYNCVGVHNQVRPMATSSGIEALKQQAVEYAAMEVVWERDETDPEILIGRGYPQDDSYFIIQAVDQL